MNNRNFSKAVEAVSPVVATLLLVLVAAGAAIGFGVFLNGFQKKTQSNVSSDAPTETLRIGGSSTVFEMTKKIIPAWQIAHPTIKIDSQEGGSGVGKQAICRGTVDIGASSSAIAASGSPGQDLATCPDSNGDGVKDAQDLKETVVAYDAVVMAFATGSSTCPAASGLDLTPSAIQELYNVNGALKAATTVGSAVFSGGLTLAGKTVTINSVSSGTTLTPASGSVPFTAGDVGKVVSGAGIPASTTISSVSSGVATISAAVTAATTSATVSPFFAGAPTGTSGSTPVYTWADICVGGSATQNVVLGERSDQGGTEDGFCSKFLKNDGTHCTSDTHQLISGSTGYYTKTVGSSGNEGIRAWLKSTSGALSFIGYGSVAESNSGIVTGAMQGVTPSASTIKTAGLNACSPTSTTPSQFCAARPLEYITIGEPTGSAKAFLDFVLETQHNLDFATQAGYVSIYA
jgi:ABC-type phosphate transport system substrate-binding protein